MSTKTAHDRIVADLTSRWPESRIAPSLARIQALCDLLGNPERSAPVIQITGTNGKGSTAVMIESMLRASGLRTGRFSSPHLQDITERISIDGEPIATEAFDELYEQILPLAKIVDEQQHEGVRLTFFEMLTALAFAAFADAPVDVMVLEVGMGGSWDSTNVADAQVAVITPIDLDHTHILGETIAEIAGEKAGIIKQGSTAVIAGQPPEAAQVLLARCAEVGAQPILEGPGFGLLSREPALGGQVIRIQTADGPLGDIHLPLHGAHMANNAALAVAATEAFFGGKALPPEVIVDGLGQIVAPARLETVKQSPTVLLDTAHNPHGVRAVLDTVETEFAFEPLIGVVAMMRDKAVDEVMSMLAGSMQRIVCTTVQSTKRGLTPDELAEAALSHFGPDRIDVADDMVDALERAVELADDAGTGAGILVIGSLISAGEARDHLVGPGPARGTAEGLPGVRVDAIDVDALIDDLDEDEADDPWSDRHRREEDDRDGAVRDGAER